MRIVKGIWREILALRSEFLELKGFGIKCISRDGLSLRFTAPEVKIGLRFSHIVDHGFGPSPIPYNNYRVKYPYIDWQVTCFAGWEPPLDKSDPKKASKAIWTFIVSRNQKLCRKVDSIVWRHLKKIEDLEKAKKAETRPFKKTGKLDWYPRKRRGITIEEETK